MSSSLQRADFFVTGTDTEIGKTLVTAALLHAFAEQGYDTVGMKPIAAGAEWRDGAWHNEDVDMLQAASSVKVPQAACVPFLMQAPAAPHIVAKREGIEIHAEPIQNGFRALQQQANCVIVEGVGGFQVP